MKYDTQLASLKIFLPQAQNILIALPAQITIDNLGASLAIFLSLKGANKKVLIATEDTLKVSHSNLFGVGEVKNTIEGGVGGDLTLSLEGVVEADGKVPALEKLDYFPEGENLNLVFRVMPGKTFSPKRIVPKYSNSGYDLIFVIGANSLEDLGGIYSSNQQVFSSAQVVNINNQVTTAFGQHQIVDPQAGTLSEIIAQILPGLGLAIDQDSASNILIGIYDQTANLSQNLTPDTLYAAGYAMQSGGKLPSPVAAAPIEQQFAQTFTSQVVTPVATPQVQTPAMENFTAQQVVSIPVVPSGQPQPTVTVPQVSFQTHEEKPVGEFASGGSVESPEVSQPAPDWLTPKIYKGGGGLG